MAENFIVPCSTTLGSDPYERSLLLSYSRSRRQGRLSRFENSCLRIAKEKNSPETAGDPDSRESENL